MKWRNIDKKVRREQWHVAIAPKKHNVTAAQDWCKTHPSDGCFYNHYTNTRWWFEKEKDAVLFTLKWS